MSVRTICCLMLCCFLLEKAKAAFLWVQAYVNEHPVKLKFRTSHPGLLLFRKTADRANLQLRLGENVPGSKSIYWTTEDCPVTLQWSGFQKTVLTSRVDVVEFSPHYPTAFEGGDGYLGWGTVRENIIELDLENPRLRFHKKVPAKAQDWIKVGVRTNQGIDHLVLEIKDSKGRKIPVAIETGLHTGVGLLPRQWQAWDEANGQVPRTLTVLANNEGKLKEIEQGWAERYEIGPLTFTEVPVEEADPVNARRIGGTEGVVLGLTALRNLELIVDAPNGVAYVKSKKSRARSYHHSRLGAVFVLSDDLKSLVAIVAQGSPAFQAGVRDGDVLVSLNGRHFDKVSMKELPGINEWFTRVKTTSKLWMVFRRGDQTFEARPVLRNILPPEK